MSMEAEPGNNDGKLNILVVTDKLYPDETGGSCTVAYELIQQWQKSCAVDIFTCPQTSFSDDTVFEGSVFRDLTKINFFTSKNKVVEPAAKG